MNFCISWASQVAQMVKNPPAILETQEMWVRTLSPGEQTVSLGHSRTPGRLLYL